MMSMRPTNGTIPNQQQQQQQRIPQQQGQVIMPPPIQSVPPQGLQQGTGLPVPVHDLSQPLPGAPPGQLLPGIGNVMPSSSGGVNGNGNGGMMPGMKPNDGVISGH
ncbi:unnamed protein product [Ambrosiozyma monospora]|uniref:Unnamed protein product n=1 Tax=Ambrosiozyma monospora TaxID=43982 RepID=A0A9W7DFE8_AMBMO|nr:unnamed protein product [Ambrosiozyma monospora]